MREPEGEGLAARAPDSPAAARPRPAAACPTAATAEREEAGCAAQPRAALAARATVALWTPEARRGQLGTGGAGRRDRAGRRSALPSSATRPLPPACSARACALRAPLPLMSCGARGLAGLGGRAPAPPPHRAALPGEPPRLVSTRVPPPSPERLAGPGYFCFSHPPRKKKIKILRDQGDICCWSLTPNAGPFLRLRHRCAEQWSDRVGR